MGLDAQREAVTGYLNVGNWNLVGEFTEIESGNRSDRGERALAACKKQKAKLVGVFKRTSAVEPVAPTR